MLGNIQTRAFPCTCIRTQPSKNNVPWK